MAPTATIRVGTAIFSCRRIATQISKLSVCVCTRSFFIGMGRFCSDGKPTTAEFAEQICLSSLANFLSIQRRLDGVEQCIFAERLAQEIHRTSGNGLFPLVLARSGGDKNDRNALVGALQISLQF
jgi:hypothetical protein